MNKTSPALFVFWLALLAGRTASQPQPEQPTTTSLCELAKNPAAYDGRIVQVRSQFVSRFHWAGFIDGNCSAKISVGVHHVLDDLTPQQGEYAFTTSSEDFKRPERLNWKPMEAPRPVPLRENESYRIFKLFAEAKSRWADGAVCADCPLYRITVTATGRFEYFETQTVAVRANAGAQPVLHAAGNAPLLRLALESLSGVEAMPIHPSLYSADKPRTINLEEASGLVFAYLKSLRCT
ncbi:MAG: hypothetical protein ABSG25_12455, partial [Bryobacteraceae bacterium]